MKSSGSRDSDFVKIAPGWVFGYRWLGLPCSGKEWIGTILVLHVSSITSFDCFSWYSENKIRHYLLTYFAYDRRREGTRELCSKFVFRSRISCTLNPSSFYLRPLIACQGHFEHRKCNVRGYKEWIFCHFQLHLVCRVACCDLKLSPSRRLVPNFAPYIGSFDVTRWRLVGRF